jgi:hypothetical protein
VPWDTALGNSQILAIHAALLPTGRILLFGGDEHSQAQHDQSKIDHSRLYDPVTGLVSTLSSPTTDVFCAGEAFLPDGRLLVAGGTETWSGQAGEHGHGPRATSRATVLPGSSGRAPATGNGSPTCGRSLGTRRRTREAAAGTPRC